MNFLVPVLLGIAAIFAIACQVDITPEAPVAPPTQTRIPSTVTPSPVPTVPPTATPPPTPTPVLQLSGGSAIVIGGEVRTRSGPTSKSEMQGFLPDKQPVEIAQRVQGENWLIGAQTWVTAAPSWATEWFKLGDGTFVYSPFIFILQPGEVSPIATVPAGTRKWIDVDIAKQTARAMIGDRAVFTAPISSGSTAFPTPKGSFEVQRDGRVAVEKMTATQAGYEPGQTQYDVERVLFTQYFDLGGNALHLNYWRPHAVFGRTATSHGCIGMELHEAQYFWLFAEPGTKVEIH